MDDQVFTLMNDRIERIEDKVDSLLRFKYQIMGSTAVVSLILGLVINFLMAK